MTGLSKTFPGLRALDDVDFTVRAGEIVALVGQNGSGKSTLVKILTGIYEPDPGGAGSTLRAALAVHVIHQDLGLIPQLNTVENLDLGPAPRRARRAAHRPRAEAEHARELLAAVRRGVRRHRPGRPAHAGGADDRRDRAGARRVGAAPTAC